MRIPLFVILLAACSSTPPVTQTGPYAWTQLKPLGSGGFPASPGNTGDQPLWDDGRFPMTLRPVVSKSGEMWMVSQLSSYSSMDGLAWTRHDKADWGERIADTFVFFGDRFLVLGGLHYSDRIAMNEIWSSNDGITWQLAGHAEWPARKGFAAVEHRGKLWVIGGTAEVDPKTFVETKVLNDVWNSDDGLHWTKIADAPWTGRDYPRVVAFGDQMFMLGGNNAADVWSSADGVTWTQLTANAPWGARYAASGLVFDGKMWVIGGFIGPSTNAQNDVWFSSDGATWTKQEHTPWEPRSPISTVFRDRVWIFSGKHTGASDNWGGDIWAMSR